MATMYTVTRAALASNWNMRRPDGYDVADGSIVPTTIGVNPFLTISALTERIAEHLVTRLGGTPAVV